MTHIDGSSYRRAMCGKSMVGEFGYSYGRFFDKTIPKDTCKKCMQAALCFVKMAIKESKE
jgi:hypothetical protein